MQRWEPSRQAPAAPYAVPPFLTGLGRGARNLCPCCGKGRVFRPGLRNYLKVVAACPDCGAPLGVLPADDAPPYFTIFGVGHLMLPMLLLVEMNYEPPIWVHMVLWLPLFTLACVLALRPIKGAVLGWLCALGFDGTEHAPAPAPVVDRP